MSNNLPKFHLNYIYSVRFHFLNIRIKQEKDIGIFVYLFPADELQLQNTITFQTLEFQTCRQMFLDLKIERMLQELSVEISSCKIQAPEPNHLRHLIRSCPK